MRRMRDEGWVDALCGVLGADGVYGVNRNIVSEGPCSFAWTAVSTIYPAASWMFDSAVYTRPIAFQPLSDSIAASCIVSNRPSDVAPH